MIKSDKEKKCITTNGYSLSLNTCDENDLNQKWDFNEIYVK